MAKLGSFPGGRERSPGVWEVRASTGARGPDGRYREISKTVHGGKRTAQDARASLIADIRAGKYREQPASVTTLGHVLDLWVTENRARWAPRTLKSHVDVIDRFIRPELGATKLDALTPGRVAVQYRQWEAAGVGAATRVSIHRTLHAALERAVRLELVHRNAARLAGAPARPASTRSTPAIADLGRVVAHCDELVDGRPRDQRMASLIRVAIQTGARRGELAGLRWCDLDLDDGWVTITAALTVDDGHLVRRPTKTGQTKRIALDAATVAALRAWRKATAETYLRMGWPLDDTEPVWRQRASRRPIYPDTISQTWRTHADDVGLTGVRFHDIRHAVATTLVASGRDVRAVADRLGHASPKMTLDVYSHGAGETSRADADYLAAQLGR